MFVSEYSQVFKAETTLKPVRIFRVVLLFSYQRTLCLCELVVRISDSLFILSHSFCFVKNFLKLFFQNLFENIQVPILGILCKLSFHRSENHVTTSCVVCQELFSFSWLTDSLAESNGEGGIWTLAPLLTTCTLSRGVPSASWVLLQSTDAWTSASIYHYRQV